MNNTSLLDIYNKISVQQYKTDVAFRTLVEGMHENIYVIPEYQRKYRWNKEQVEELAASLIRDLPIPPIYTFRNEKGQLEILDGQQRVMSLYFYYIGKFFKSDKESVFDYRELDVDASENFELALEAKYEIVPTNFYMRIENKLCDISYSSLPDIIRRKIDYNSIPVVEIKVADSERKDATLHKIFTNLNSGGKQLSEQELRNGIYPCKFSRMIDVFNRTNSAWRAYMGAISHDGRDAELLYRLCALSYYTVFEGREFHIQNYRYSIKELIDDFAEQAYSFSDAEVYGFEQSLKGFIERLNISKSNYKKVTLLEGVYIVSEKLKVRCDVTDEICAQILNSDIFRKTTSGGTISLSNMNKRWLNIYEIISKYDTGIKKDISE